MRIRVRRGIIFSEIIRSFCNISSDTNSDLRNSPRTLHPFLSVSRASRTLLWLTSFFLPLTWSFCLSLGFLPLTWSLIKILSHFYSKSICDFCHSFSQSLYCDICRHLSQIWITIHDIRILNYFGKIYRKKKIPSWIDVLILFELLFTHSKLWTNSQKELIHQILIM